MSDQSLLLSPDSLIEVLNLTKTATAVHIGETAIIQYANDAMLKIWGKGREIIGKSLAEALPELKGQPFIDMFARVWREGLVLSGTDTAADLVIDGVLTTFYFDFEYRAIKDENGKVIATIHSAIDVTDRFLKKEAITRAQEKEEALIREQSLNEELAATNEELNAANEGLNLSREELKNLNQELEERVKSRVKDLMETEIRFQTMAEGSDILIAVGDETGNATYLNKAWTRLTGRSMKELLSFGWVDLIHPDDKDRYVDIYLSAFQKREPFAGEFRVLDKNGNYRWLYAQGPPRFKSDGSFAGYISSAIDITDRKLEEIERQELAEELATTNEELASSNEELMVTNEELISAQNLLGDALTSLSKSETKLKNLIADAPIAISLLSGRGMIVETANAKILEIWGKGYDVIGKPIIEAIPELVGQPFLQLLDNVYTSGLPYYGNEAKALLENQDVYVNFVYQPIKDEAGVTSNILITATDVTEQVLARRKVEQAQERLKMAVDAADMGTYAINAETLAFDASARLKELFGFLPNEEISYDDCLQQIREDYRVAAIAMIKKSGKKGNKFEFEYPVIGFHDGKERWLRGVGELIFDDAKTKSFFTGVVIDITERVKDEQRKNDFIGMVSHELKTPITSLSAYLQLLQKRAQKAEDEFTATALDKSVKQVKRMTTMINDFLNISRLESGKINIDKHQFDLADLMIEMKEEALTLFTSHDLQFGPIDNAIVFADKDKIGQVINNVLGNAVKYSPQGSKVVISCVKKENIVEVMVRDEGIGIEAKDLDLMFERYYRIDNNDNISGFGIGLYLSLEILNLHQGKIWAESEVGKGSTFHFTLPLAVN